MMIKVYTKKGDKGMTSLMRVPSIPKSDDRIELLGTIDELTSHIGEVKSFSDCPDFRGFLERIQKTLQVIMAGVADNGNFKYELKEEETTALEDEIDRLDGLYEREAHFVLPGGCRQSARLDVTRTVARRAERAMTRVSRSYGMRPEYLQYMNRLSDYLFTAARYLDSEAAKGRSGERGSGVSEGSIVTEVLKQMGALETVSLDMAKKLIEKIEAHAKEEGKAAVIAVCNPQGNPIAVHCMDGAYLVSFDVATKKAYTSVAVKMSTSELSRLAQPGGTFYGLDKLDDGKIVIFGGGVPLKSGDKIIGGLGISGGTSEEDAALAEYGLQAMAEILGNKK
jgi:ATP:cob(I)alamin adenosyltransferase